MMRRLWWLGLVVWLPQAGFAQTARSVTSASGATASYRATADWVVASLTEEPGELRGPDTGVSVTVYGDGRAVIHYPANRKRAGDYETRLKSAEVDRLVALVAEHGLTEFDPAAVRQEKAKATRRRRESGEVLMETADATVSAFEMAVESYESSGSPGGARTRRGPQRRSIRWSGLSSDAQQLPEIGPLQGLEALRAALMQLRERRDLRSMAQ